MQSYPSTLPYPSSRYSFSVQGSARRTVMDSGRVRQVRVGGSQLHKCSVEFDLTNGELALWRAFWNVGASNGSEPVLMPLAFGGGLNINVARFVGPYQVSNVGAMDWNVKVSMEVDAPVEITTQGALETAGAALGLVGTAWGDVIPRIQSAYSYSVSGDVARTNLEGGGIYQRRRSKRNTHAASVNWILTDAEMAFFKGWHRVILEFGSLPFEIDLPFGDGDDVETVTARFANGEFSASYIAGDDSPLWSVTASLDVENVADVQTVAGFNTLLTASFAAVALPESEAGSASPGVFPYLALDLMQAGGDSDDFRFVGGGSLNLMYAEGNDNSAITTLAQAVNIMIAEGGTET